MSRDADTVQVMFGASCTHAEDLTVDRPVRVQVAALDGWLDEDTAADVGQKLKAIGEAMIRFAGDAREVKAAYRVSQLINIQTKGTA